MPDETPAHVYQEILEQIDSGACILFLGSGSTRNCRKANGDRGLTGSELAQEILARLNGGADPGFTASLTEASEYYTTWKAPARRGLDRLIQERLRGLLPTLGHYLATTFPWRAVITTNYNQVVEDCWGAAVSEGYATSELLPIRTDEDLATHSGNTTHIRLYKPHGCVTIPDLQQHRMVLSSFDYFASERIRPRMYEEIRRLSASCTTLFVGYSMADYTFRNIYYTLYHDLGEWAVRSFSVSPVPEAQKSEWMERSMDRSFNTTLVNDAFCTFMARLALARGALPANAKRAVADHWAQMVGDCSNIGGVDYVGSLLESDIQSLPS